MPPLALVVVAVIGLAGPPARASDAELRNALRELRCPVFESLGNERAAGLTVYRVKCLGRNQREVVVACDERKCWPIRGPHFHGEPGSR